MAGKPKEMIQINLSVLYELLLKLFKFILKFQ